MDVQLTGRLGARHLSQIQEESDSREHSACFLPPIVQQQQTGAAGKPAGKPGGAGKPVAAGKPGMDAAEREEVRCLSDPSLVRYDQQDNRSLLEELGRIEAELRESERLEVARQQEAEFLRQQENKLLRTSLCYLSLSQRVARPWVTSYFRKFPMHMYCLPVQAANQRGRRRGLARRR